LKDKRKASYEYKAVRQNWIYEESLDNPMLLGLQASFIEVSRLKICINIKVTALRALFGTQL